MPPIEYSISAQTALDGSAPEAVMAAFIAAQAAPLLAALTDLTDANDPAGHTDIEGIPAYVTATSDVSSNLRGTAATANTANTAIIENSNEIRARIMAIAGLIGSNIGVDTGGSPNGALGEILATPITASDTSVVAGTAWQAKVLVINKDIYSLAVAVNGLCNLFGVAPLDIDIPEATRTTSQGLGVTFTGGSAAGPLATKITSDLVIAASNYSNLAAKLNVLTSLDFADFIALR